MTLVASFTRSYREAQTYLTSVLLVPTLPIAFASIYSLKTKSSLMLIPSLSQHLLMTSVLKDEPIAPLDVLVSAGSRIGPGAAVVRRSPPGTGAARLCSADAGEPAGANCKRIRGFAYRRFPTERGIKQAGTIDCDSGEGWHDTFILCAQRISSFFWLF